MIENVEVAYCMAKLEDIIRSEKRTADMYLEFNDGKEDHTYTSLINGWATKVTLFEFAFGVSYFE